MIEISYYGGYGSHISPSCHADLVVEDDSAWPHRLVLASLAGDDSSVKAIAEHREERVGIPPTGDGYTEWKHLSADGRHRILTGKTAEGHTHALVLSRRFLPEGDLAGALLRWLRETTSLPVLAEWAPLLVEEARERAMLQPRAVHAARPLPPGRGQGRRGGGALGGARGGPGARREPVHPRGSRDGRSVRGQARRVPGGLGSGPGRAGGRGAPAALRARADGGPPPGHRGPGASALRPAGRHGRGPGPDPGGAEGRLACGRNGNGQDRPERRRRPAAVLWPGRLPRPGPGAQATWSTESGRASCARWCPPPGWCCCAGGRTCSSSGTAVTRPPVAPSGTSSPATRPSSATSAAPARPGARRALPAGPRRR